MSRPRQVTRPDSFAVLLRRRPSVRRVRRSSYRLYAPIMGEDRKIELMAISREDWQDLGPEERSFYASIGADGLRQFLADAGPDAVLAFAVVRDQSSAN